jgi:DNA-binding winged helix-turn-helix (wHTH) protein
VFEQAVGASASKNGSESRSHDSPEVPRPSMVALWFGDFRLDRVNECLWDGSTRIELTPKAFAVLRYLVEHTGRLVTQRELLDAVWPGIHVQPEILKTYVRDIRKVLGDDPRAPRFIETRPRRGYSFLAAVRDEDQPSGASPSSVASAAGKTSLDLLRDAVASVVPIRALEDLPLAASLDGGAIRPTLAEILQRQALAQALLWLELSRTLPMWLAHEPIERETGVEPRQVQSDGGRTPAPEARPTDGAGRGPRIRPRAVSRERDARRTGRGRMARLARREAHRARPRSPSDLTRQAHPESAAPTSSETRKPLGLESGHRLVDALRSPAYGV